MAGRHPRETVKRIFDATYHEQANVGDSDYETSIANVRAILRDYDTETAKAPEPAEEAPAEDDAGKRQGRGRKDRMEQGGLNREE